MTKNRGKLGEKKKLKKQKRKICMTNNAWQKNRMENLEYFYFIPKKKKKENVYVWKINFYVIEKKKIRMGGKLYV